VQVQLVNILVDDSAAMAGLGVQAARQAGLQLLQFIDRRDRASGSNTRCSVWTFSHAAIEVGLNLRAEELFELPLRGHGPSQPDRALRAAATASHESIDTARLQSSDRRNFRASVCTVMIGDPGLATLRWNPAESLNCLGRLGLVLIDCGSRYSQESNLLTTPFQTVVHASHLSSNDLETLLES
jgi:hypothetical protein